MTDDRIALRELLEKGSDASFLREMIGFAAQRLMELESDGLCGAAHGERSAERVNQRNGYRERARYMTLETIGTISVLNPSACLPWHPDLAAQPAQELRSYIRPWDTIQARAPLAQSLTEPNKA